MQFVKIHRKLRVSTIDHDDINILDILIYQSIHVELENFIRVLNYSTNKV